MTNLEYSNARIKGLKSFLISENDMKIALEMKSVRDFSSWLESSSYKSSVDGKSLLDIENGLFLDLLKTSEKILRIVPENTVSFFSARLSYFEIESLKLLFNLKSSGISNENRTAFLTGKLKKLANALSSADSAEEISEILKKTKYGDVISGCLERKEDVCSGLDRYYFERLWEEVGKLPRGYRPLVREIIGTEIDCANIMLALRAKARGEDKCPVIPIFHNLKNNFGTSCDSADGVRGVISLISESAYVRILDDAIRSYSDGKSLFMFEQLLRRRVANAYKKAASDTLSIGVPLAYVKMKENEITNLRSVSMGLSSGMSKPEIEEMIL